MWKFIMRADDNSDLYGLGHFGALANRVTRGIVLIYSVETDLLIY